MRKCKLSFRIISGLLCDKPWCDPIVLTTIAVGFGKLEDFQWTIFNTHSCCPFSASIPPLALPFASSFFLLLLLAAVYGALTGVRRYLLLSFGSISLTSPLNAKHLISSEPIKIHLNSFHSIWIRFNPSESVSIHLNWFNSIWIRFNPSESVSIHLNHY